MYDDYFNQSLVWEDVISVDHYNEKTVLTTTLKGRLESGFKLVRNEQGEETVSSGVVFTRSAVSVNDKVDGRLVIASEPKRDLSGTIQFYEVYLI